MRTGFLIIGLCAAVSLGYAVEPCAAALLTMSQGESGDPVRSGSGPGDSESPPPGDDIPDLLQILDEHHSQPGAPVSGASGSSAVGSGSILSDRIDFDVSLSATDRVHLRSWLWLPLPPEDDLLKVPRCR